MTSAKQYERPSSCLTNKYFNQTPALTTNQEWGGGSILELTEIKTCNILW